MSHNYRETDEECQGCGATAADRRKNVPRATAGPWLNPADLPSEATDTCTATPGPRSARSWASGKRRLVPERKGEKHGSGP
jgi:hypothetical protein